MIADRKDKTHHGDTEKIRWVIARDREAKSTADERKSGWERSDIIECRALPLFDPARAARSLLISSEWPRSSKLKI